MSVFNKARKLLCSGAGLVLVVAVGMVVLNVCSRDWATAGAWFVAGSWALNARLAEINGEEWRALALRQHAALQQIADRPTIQWSDFCVSVAESFPEEDRDIIQTALDIAIAPKLAATEA